jgi:hypothetical protein
LFPLFHIARDCAWVAAIATWLVRRAMRAEANPAHSMMPREAPSSSGLTVAPVEQALDGVLCIIPAHNEAESLPAVIGELRDVRPDLHILVVDDGSTDDTPALLRELDVRWLRLPYRMGIGSAVRAGLRYAGRLGFAAVVRLDGDGQHRVTDIRSLLEPIADGTADVVLGSRFTRGSDPSSGLVRFLQRALAAVLSVLTGSRVTDPTSGFFAAGPKAMAILAEHHPTGYAEPELRLLMSRSVLRVLEVPIDGRSRFRGSTSLTPARMAAAAARVLLAVLIVPLRRSVGGASD